MPKTTTGTAHRHKTKSGYWSDKTDAESASPHTHDVDLSGYATRTEWAQLVTRVTSLEGGEPAPPPPPVPVPVPVPPPVPTPVPPPTGLKYPPKTKPLVFTPRPPAPALQPVGVPWTDPSTGTKVTRINNVANQGQSYSTLPAFNCTGELILLVGFGAPLALHSGKAPYGFIKVPKAPGHPSFACTDPNLIYGTGDGLAALRVVNVQTGQETHKAIPGVYDVSLLAEGSLSNDDQTIALAYRAANGGPYGILVMNPKTGAVGPRQMLPAIGRGLDHPSTSQLGNYVLAAFKDGGSGMGQGTWVWNADLTNPRQISAGNSAHGDMGLTKDGREVWFTCHPRVAYCDLATGQWTDVLPSSTAYVNGHVSTRNFQRPGVGLLSVGDLAQAGKPGADEVVAAHFDGSGVERFGFQFQTVPGSTYQAQPQATFSPDGTKALFRSDRGGNPIYAYIGEAA